MFISRDSYIKRRARELIKRRSASRYGNWQGEGPIEWRKPVYGGGDDDTIRDFIITHVRISILSGRGV